MCIRDRPSWARIGQPGAESSTTSRAWRAQGSRSPGKILPLQGAFPREDEWNFKRAQAAPWGLR
eukprot:8153497-Pyramimonas_sp.AAC.1